MERSKCEACGGLGLLAPAAPSGAVIPPGLVPVQRCDACRVYDDDMAAAKRLSLNAHLEPIRLGRGRGASRSVVPVVPLNWLVTELVRLRRGVESAAGLLREIELGSASSGVWVGENGDEVEPESPGAEFHEYDWEDDERWLEAVARLARECQELLGVKPAAVTPQPVGQGVA